MKKFCHGHLRDLLGLVEYDTSKKDLELHELGRDGLVYITDGRLMLTALGRAVVNASVARAEQVLISIQDGTTKIDGSGLFCGGVIGQPKEDPEAHDPAKWRGPVSPQSGEHTPSDDYFNSLAGSLKDEYGVLFTDGQFAEMLRVLLIATWRRGFTCSQRVYDRPSKAEGSVRMSTGSDSDTELSVRQLYYQLVARGEIENTLQSYKRVAGVINTAKEAGYIDWDAIVDRTREFIVNNHWTSGSSIIRACVSQYREDMWSNQENRVFVIIEKEALVGVLEDLCEEHDVPLLAARGYPSGTVLREFTQRHLLPCIEAGQEPQILHLGDHDPSGIDMTRDIIERLEMFTYGKVGHYNVDRIALTMDQVEEQDPPENPAKTTDSRFRDYSKKFGESSWELDALSPQYLNRLVKTHILLYKDDARWAERQDRVETIKEQLRDRAAEQEEAEDASQ